MKRMLLITTILAMNLTYCQLYDSFDIPTFDYKTAKLDGDPLMRMTSSGGESVTDMSFGGEYEFMSQSPAMTYSYGGELDYVSDGSAETTNFSLEAPFSVNKYFEDSHGPFAFAHGSLALYGGDAWDGNDDTKDLKLTVGGGYGRIVDAGPVAVAAAIAGELGGASDATILEMAAIINKDEAGWYAKTHKDNAFIQFYDDLAAALGKPDAAMQIHQIHTQTDLYKISERSIGWEVKAGLADNYFRADGDETKGLPWNLQDPINSLGLPQFTVGLSLEADYAKPIGNAAQMTAGFKYLKDMTDDGGNLLQLTGGYTYDHSYNWASSVSFTHQSVVTVDGGDAVTALQLKASSSKAILSKLMGTASFSYMSFSEVDDPMTELEARVTYYLF